SRRSCRRGARAVPGSAPSEALLHVVERDRLDLAQNPPAAAAIGAGILLLPPERRAVARVVAGNVLIDELAHAATRFASGQQLFRIVTTLKSFSNGKVIIRA